MNLWEVWLVKEMVPDDPWDTRQLHLVWFKEIWGIIFWNWRSLERSFHICMLLQYPILLSLLLLQFSRGFTLQNWSHSAGGLLFCLLLVCLDSILNSLNSSWTNPCCGANDLWREVGLCPPPTIHWECATTCFYQKQLLKDFLLQPTEGLLLTALTLAVCREKSGENKHTHLTASTAKRHTCHTWPGHKAAESQKSQIFTITCGGV